MITLGNARFTFYSHGCVRLEYARNGKFSPFPSLVMDRLPIPITPATHKNKKRIRITTDHIELNYHDTGEVFNPENLTIEHVTAFGEKAVWTPGKKNRGNFGTITRCLDYWTHDRDPAKFQTEGILSADGGHYIGDEARVYWHEDYQWPVDLSQSIAVDGYFFAYGNNFKQALLDFVTVFGPIPMIPRWAFGFWYSRYHAYRDTEVLAVAKRYRKEGIPIDVMVIDTDWRGGRNESWGGYDWNPKLFPKPRETVKALHRMGIRVSLNDHPGYDNYDSLPDGESHIPAIEKRLGPLPHQGRWACDWSNKMAVKAWKDILLGPLFDLGMDFWWVDGWIKSPFGKFNSQHWANRVYFDVTEEKTNKRGMILSRFGGLGSHRYPVQFSGDTSSDWRTLKFQIDFTARSCGLGAIYWSHDIGGFLSARIDEELFIRWVQFGAMSPIFRTHSNHGIREPWHFSARARKIFRKMTRMRCALAPYLYTLAREAHDTGLPICRPVWLENFSEQALRYRDQYLLGNDLLVIPADSPGQQTKRAFFPKGRWYSLETDDVIDGPVEMEIDTPIERIPVYVREGAIIPSQAVGDAIGTEVPDEIFFDYYPSEQETAYTLYEDDGESRAYLKGKCSWTTIKANREGFRISKLAKNRTVSFRVRLAPDEKAGPNHRVVRTALAGELATRGRYRVDR